MPFACFASKPLSTSPTVFWMANEFSSRQSLWRKRVNRTGHLKLAADCVLLKQLAGLVGNFPVNVQPVAIGVADEGVKFDQREVIVNKWAQEGVRGDDFIEVL